MMAEMLAAIGSAPVVIGANAAVELVGRAAVREPSGTGATDRATACVSRSARSKSLRSARETRATAGSKAPTPPSTGDFRRFHSRGHVLAQEITRNSSKLRSPRTTRLIAAHVFEQLLQRAVLVMP